MQIYVKRVDILYCIYEKTTALPLTWQTMMLMSHCFYHDRKKNKDKPEDVSSAMTYFLNIYKCVFSLQDEVIFKDLKSAQRFVDHYDSIYVMDKLCSYR